MPPKKDSVAKNSAEGDAEKPTRIQPPNKEQYKADINAKNTEIEKLQKEMQGVQKKIQEKSTHKEDFYEEKSRLAAKLSTYKEQIDKLNANRKELQEHLKSHIQQKKNLTNTRIAAEKSLTFMTESEVDAAIQKIEFEMCTGSLTLQAEKRKVVEIQNLKKQKPKINAAAEKLEALKGKEKELSNPETFDGIKEQIDAVYKKCDQVWNEKEEIKKELTTLIETHKKENETSELNMEKKELHSKITKLVTERNELRQNLQAEEYAFRKHEQEMRKLAAEKRALEGQKRREKIEKEQMERQMEQLLNQPHLAEVALLEQTINFCKTLLPKTQKEEVENVEPEYNSPEGYAVIVKKKDREEEMFMTATKKKGLHKKNKTASSNVIKHDAYTFRLFEALKITAPSTTDQIPATLETLTSELTKYQEKIAEWEKKKDDGTLLKEFQEKAAAKTEAKKAAAAETTDVVETTAAVAE